jgi:hypothetical protein
MKTSPRALLKPKTAASATRAECYRTPKRSSACRQGVPQGDDVVQVTNPYYRRAYALVFKQGHGLEGVDTLGDPRLKNKHIGIVAGTVSWPMPR